MAELLDIDAVIAQLLKVHNSRPGTCVQLTEPEVRGLCLKSREIFLSQPMLLELETPLKICGSIHGQYYDLLQLFELAGFPPEANYMFLGNYVDYGQHSLETMCLLLAYKIKYPENFFLLRGAHECASLNREHGFYDECKKHYNIHLWKAFTDCFNCLPVAAILDEKIFCTSGGLSPNLKSMEQIRKVKRPTDIPNKGLLCDLMWAEPERDTEGWGKILRNKEMFHTFGPDVISAFLAKHDMDLVVRSNQTVMKGHKFFAGKQLLTVFSASNHRGESNDGAVIDIAKNRVVTYQTFNGRDNSLHSDMQETQTTASHPEDSPATQNDDPSSMHTSGAEVKKSAIIDVKEIQIGKHLGRGGFGVVYEARWKTKTVAVKVCLGNLVQNYPREIEILTSLPPHPNVLIFFGIALSSDGVSTSIITELATNGSLHDYLHVKKEEPSPDQSFAWALQIASGMQHLHNNNVVHRDLKSGNILLSFGLLAKICDFGTARNLANTAMTTQKGTYRWMAPEIVEHKEANISKMCDVFSYGMVLYEIFAREIPYADISSNARVGMAVMEGKRPPIPATLPPFLHPLLEACWKENPKKRPQFETIVMAIHTGSFE